MRLLEQIKELIVETKLDRFDILNEVKLPSEMIRRIEFDKIDKLISKEKSFFFQDDESEKMMVEKSIDKLIGYVASSVLPDDEDYPPISFSTFKDALDTLEDYIYQKYVNELTAYYEKRKKDYLEEMYDDFSYLFIKHSGKIGDLKNTGFAEHFSDFSKLLSKYGSWLDLDWDEIKTKLDAINDYPERMGAFLQSYPMLISKRGDKGNNWGYNFSIAKAKRYT